MNSQQKAFVEVRDIPYSIPLLYGAEDKCCSGKHKMLLALLEKNGHQARWRVCTFKWSSLNLPEKLLSVPHSDDCTHAYLEVKIEGDWKSVDATWDKPLASVLPVNEWDGVSDTMIAVQPIQIFSPEESLAIMQDDDREAFEKDISINGAFYQAFNEWLEEVRAARR